MISFYHSSYVNRREGIVQKMTPRHGRRGNRRSVSERRRKWILDQLLNALKRKETP